MSTRGRFWRRRSDDDFHEEIRSHLDLEADRLANAGLGPDDARHASRRAFGNVAGVQEQFFERSRWIWLEQLRQDVRYAVRTLWRSRTFAASTSLTLAIALALVTVLFAVFNAYVLRHVALPDPDSVYQLAWQRAPDADGATFTWQEFKDVQDRHDLFDGAVAHRFQMLSTEGRTLHAAFVSGNYFDTLRPQLRLGRALAEFDTANPGGAPVVVLSDPGWAMLFDRDPHVLGRHLEIHGQQFEIVGVTRPEFSGLDDYPLDMWLPLTMLPVTVGDDLFGPAKPRELTIFARLRRGITAAQADDALTPFMADVVAHASSGPSASWQGVRSAMRPRTTLNELSLSLILLLSPIFAAFGLILIAACANVSSVMLARALGRQREIGIRLSVGASRSRVVRQLLTEAAIIALAAGGLGLAIAGVVLPAGRRVFFATLPPTLAELARVVPLQIDLRVFAFSLAVAATATVLCAVLPAFQATSLRLTSALRGDVSAKLSSGLLRNVLVVGQVAVSLILLTAAATIARNRVAVAATDLGYDTSGVFSINQRGTGSNLIAPAVRLLQTQPAIEQIAVTSANPLFGNFGTIGTIPTGSDELRPTPYVFVSPEYFPLLRIPLVRGRPFSDAESLSEAHVGIISERTARLLFGSTDPLGQAVKFVPAKERQADPVAGYRSITVIGVVKDVVSRTPYEGVDAAMIYLPTGQNSTHANAILARVPDASPIHREAIQATLKRVAVNHAALELVPLAEMIDIMLYPLRMASWIGSLLGLVALALSVSGLYGLLTYVLEQRTREIGIRMALGATAAGVVRMVMRQSARIVALGSGIGLLLTYSALRILDTSINVRLSNVSLVNAGSFAIGIALVTLAALVASYFPARRATRVDPCSTLRAEG